MNRNHFLVSQGRDIRHLTYSSFSTPPHRPSSEPISPTNQSSHPLRGIKLNRHTRAGGSGWSGARPPSGVGSDGRTFERTSDRTPCRKCRLCAGFQGGFGIDPILLDQHDTSKVTRSHVHLRYVLCSELLMCMQNPFFISEANFHRLMA
jgi:hypothetical protein